jgi:putative FmdB family regulatory protein
MPTYEYHCEYCGENLEVFLKLCDCDKPFFCPNCQGFMNKVITKSVIRSFKPQTLDIIDENEKPMHARNSAELKDAIKKYNDSKWADQSGKVAVLE